MIERLRMDRLLQAALEKKPYERAMVEAEAFLPHLQSLNFGMGSAHRRDRGNMGHQGLRKRPCDDEGKKFASEAEIDEAVAVLFAWLEKAVRVARSSPRARRGRLALRSHGWREGAPSLGSRGQGDGRGREGGRQSC